MEHGQLLLDVRGALPAPVSFAVGFWSGTEYRGRLPAAGALRWDGTAVPQPFTPTRRGTLGSPLPTR